MTTPTSFAAACRSRWFLPLLSLALGVAILVAGWLGGQLGVGLAGLGVMAAFGLLVLAGGRSETVRGLRGDGRDERFAAIDVRATAFAGTVVIVAVIAGWLVELAHGDDGSPYTWLGAAGGLAYLLAVARLRRRG